MPPFSAVIRPSRLLFLYAAVLHLLTAAAALLYFRLPEALLWTACLTLSFCYFMNFSGMFRAENKTVSLTVSADGTAVLSAANQAGKQHKSVLQESSISMPLFVLLVLKTESGKIFRLPVLSDSTDTESFRRLKVWTRWGTEPADAKSGKQIHRPPVPIENTKP